MSEYKYVYGSSLQHWGKGKQADDHKYTAREWVKGKWQYVYDTGKKAIQNTPGYKNKKYAENIHERKINPSSYSMLGEIKYDYNKDVEDRDKLIREYQSHPTNETKEKIAEYDYYIKNERKAMDKIKKEMNENEKYWNDKYEKSLSKKLNDGLDNLDSKIKEKLDSDSKDNIGSRSERSKVGDFVDKISSKLADKNTEILDKIGYYDKLKRDDFKKIYEKNKENSDKRKDIYEKNKYTDEQFYNDIGMRETYSDKEIEELEQLSKKLGYPTVKDMYYDYLVTSYAEYKRKNPDKEIMNHPVRDYTARETSAKLWGDSARKKKAQEAARATAESSRWYKEAQLEYDKTLLGKVEKGMNIIKGLFKKK